MILGKRKEKVQVQTPQSQTAPATPSNEDDASERSCGSIASNSVSVHGRRCMANEPRVRTLMRQFAEHAYKSYVEGAPALAHLSLLVNYNLHAALARNAEVLGVSDEYCRWEGISPLNKEGPLLSQKAIEWPASLQPTPLQMSIEHHPWVDLFPWPRLRDNLLQAFEYPEICDEDELCRDICEYSHEETKPVLIVWGSPWDPRSWEVSNDFLNKWGWLLSGCPEIINSTNYWRAKRGEVRITAKDLSDAIQSSMPRGVSHPEL